MNSLKAALLRLRLRLQLRDLLDNPVFCALLGMALLCASQLPFPTARKLALLTAATRRFDHRRLRAAGRHLLEPWLEPDQVDIWRNEKIGWHRYYAYAAFNSISKERALTTSLVLKEPGDNGEKGVLYCSFEFNWMKLIANHDARKLFREYILVGASSWSPSDHAVLANLCGLSKDPAFIGISNMADIAQYRMFAPHIHPLPIMACDWVAAEDFQPLPHHMRTIDILMVSHFRPWKRHWLLFEALRDMDPNLKVTLIGRASEGRTERELREEAAAFGVKQELTFLTHLEIDEVIRHQCNAKVSVALSKREGSCVSVTEALFADTPVVMMDDAHVGARAYINSSTGRLVNRRNFARTLEELIANPRACMPRAWATEHISARLTSKKLNTILREHALRTGQPWTRDIAPLCWRYVPRYLDEIDRLRLRPAVERLRAQHGIVLEEFVSEKVATARKVS
jgi:glycosyltransferase involved in cell wall biosynthesis